MDINKIHDETDYQNKKSDDEVGLTKKKKSCCNFYFDYQLYRVFVVDSGIF